MSGNQALSIVATKSAGSIDGVGLSVTALAAGVDGAGSLAATDGAAELGADATGGDGGSGPPCPGDPTDLARPLWGGRWLDAYDARPAAGAASSMRRISEGDSRVGGPRERMRNRPRPKRVASCNSLPASTARRVDARRTQ